MLAANQPEIIDFGRDMTLRWPCRQGDFILWIGYLNILSGSESMQIRDLWEMRDGYHVGCSHFGFEHLSQLHWHLPKVNQPSLGARPRIAF
jgi:hypothetical protein